MPKRHQNNKILPDEMDHRSLFSLLLTISDCSSNNNTISDRIARFLNNTGNFGIVSPRPHSSEGIW